VIGGIAPFVIWILTVINESTLDVAKVLMWVLRPICPTFCFAFGIMNISNREVHKTVFGYDDIKSPFDWELAGADMVFLALHFVFGMIATFLIEYLKTV
jgi:ATP-binding cassette subfamily A (ABC1) protein 3